MQTCKWLYGSTGKRGKMIKPRYCSKKGCKGYDDSCRNYTTSETLLKKLWNTVRYKICEWLWLKLTGLNKKGHF